MNFARAFNFGLVSRTEMSAFGRPSLYVTRFACGCHCTDREGRVTSLFVMPRCEQNHPFGWGGYK